MEKELRKLSTINGKIMMNKVILAVALILSSNVLFGQRDSLSRSKKKNQELQNRHSLGASLFMVLNFFPDPADYYLLTYGYRLNKQERVFIEFNTWKYAEPLGTYGSSEKFYPGFVRAYGIGIGYQRFLWHGLYATAQATPFLKHFYNVEDKKIQNGFQLYLQLVVGYRFELFHRRFYIEPAYALKYWPVDTNFPKSFAEIEKGAPKTIFEPSLNFGFRF